MGRLQNLKMDGVYYKEDTWYLVVPITTPHSLKKRFTPDIFCNYFAFMKSYACVSIV